MTVLVRHGQVHDGQNHEDVVTGTIKWEESADRSESGKGQYIFNLRFNETKHKVTDEGAVFDTQQMSAEEAFFAVDKSLPALTGKIDYIDSFGKDKDTPIYKNNLPLILSKLRTISFFQLIFVAGSLPALFGFFLHYSAIHSWDPSYYPYCFASPGDALSSED